MDFSLTLTEQYFASLKNSLDLLASNPDMGNSVDEIRSGYRRFPPRIHKIFYIIVEPDI